MFEARPNPNVPRNFRVQKSLLHTTSSSARFFCFFHCDITRSQRAHSADSTTFLVARKRSTKTGPPLPFKNKIFSPSAPSNSKCIAVTSRSLVTADHKQPHSQPSNPPFARFPCLSELQTLTRIAETTESPQNKEKATNTANIPSISLFS